MKRIDLDEDLYNYIASQTKRIGESASDILRRLLNFEKLTKDISNDEIVSKLTSTENHIKKFHRDEALLNNLEFLRNSSTIKKITDKFMIILSQLYLVDSHRFKNVEVRGRSRLYLSTSKELLIKSGTNTRPKQIPRTSFWIITNTNTERKKQIIEDVMQQMDFKKLTIESVIKII